MTTANGWPTLRAVPKHSFVAPNGHACDVASADLAVIFAYAVWRWHTEIEPVTACFGGRTYAQQMAVNRLAPTSNHVSFTAVDVNGAQHPYEASGRGYHTGFTATQERTLHAILADTGVLQWGGDFPSPYRDAMHIQVAQDLRYLNIGPRIISATKVKTEARRIGAWVAKVQKAVGVTADKVAGPATIRAVEEFQRKHKLKVDGAFGAHSQAAAGWGVPKFPLPKGHAYAVNDGTNYTHSGVRKADQESVKKIQRAVGVAADGAYGARTKAAVAAFQRKRRLTADGAVGPSTWNALF